MLILPEKNNGMFGTKVFNNFVINELQCGLICGQYLSFLCIFPKDNHVIYLV